MTISHRRRTLVALTATTVLALSGCGGDDEPTASASSSTSGSADSSPATKSTPPAKDEVAVNVEIEGEDVTPVAQAVQIGVGETVVLDITSDRAGELHVHSSPEQELEFEAGSSQLEVTLDMPGSVDIEEHESGALVVRVLVK